MKAFAKVIILLAVVPAALVAGVALFAPTPVEPVAWQAPAMPSLTEGPYAKNTALASAQVYGKANLLQVESLAAGLDGQLYTGMRTGEVIRINPAQLALPNNPQTTPFDLLGQTGGRPLGMVWHPDGFLLVADAVKGLLRFSLQGEVTVLVDQHEGQALRFVDDVAVSADGRFAYFSDASSKYGLDDYVLDILEHSGNGRLLEYDFQTGQTRVLLDGLQFANGVEMAADGQSVLINETGAYRILRLWLEGPKLGQAEVFAEGLPGFPDNIRRDNTGRYWVAIPSLRDPLLDSLSDKPARRKAIARLLNVFEFPIKPHTMVLAFDESGAVVANLQAQAVDGFYYVTQATPLDGKLYLGSVHVQGMAVIDQP